MSIAIGQLAPTFKRQTYKGDTVELDQYRGQKVWLGFYRWASCPLCNLRMSELLEHHREFEKAGIQLIGVFQSPAENIEKYVGKQGIPFPIIPDPELELYATYGVHARLAGMFYPRVIGRALRAMAKGFFSLHMDGPKAMVPADFLVDPEGVVWKAYYGSAVSDHIPFDEVREFGADLCLDMPTAPAA